MLIVLTLRNSKLCTLYGMNNLQHKIKVTRINDDWLQVCHTSVLSAHMNQGGCFTAFIKTTPWKENTIFWDNFCAVGCRLGLVMTAWKCAENTGLNIKQVSNVFVMFRLLCNDILISMLAIQLYNLSWSYPSIMQKKINLDIEWRQGLLACK